MKIRKVACLVLYDDKKRILIQDRREISRIGEVFGWFGGGVEEGETHEETITREAKEELDIDIKDFDFVAEYPLNFPNFKARIKLFITKMPNQKIICTEGKPLWITLKQAKTKLLPREAAVLPKIKEFINEN